MVVPSPAQVEYQMAHIHEDRSMNIVISHAICLPIALVAVTLRLISRRIIKASLQADDWLIIVALLFALGQITGGLLCVRFGGGKHAILLKDPSKFAKAVISTELLYSPAIAAVKISVLLLYRRLFPNRRFQTVLWCVGAFILSYTTIQTLVIIFECRPIRAAWDPFIKASCIHLNLEFIFMGTLNILTDFITLGLPMPLLWQLQISRQRKFQLIGIFLTGGVVCVLSIYRVPKMASLSLSDASWSDVDACVWSVAEVIVGIVGACLPTLRPLFARKGQFRPDRSIQDVFHPYTEDSEDSVAMTKYQNPIVAVKPSRPPIVIVLPSRPSNGDDRPFNQYRPSPGADRTYPYHQTPSKIDRIYWEKGVSFPG